MNTLFLIAWLLFIVIGVISNIRKSMQRAANSSKPTPNAQSLQTARATAARMQQPIPRPVAAPRISIQPQENPKSDLGLKSVGLPNGAMDGGSEAAVEQKRSPEGGATSGFSTQGRFRAFANVKGTNLVQAIIAQQVLGPPLALAEQSIWNQR